MVCRVCHQPECSISSGGSRPAEGAIPTRLKPGEREDRGYGEWAVHPDEAIFVLHRGYALVDGWPEQVIFIHNEAHVTQLSIPATDPGRAVRARRFVDSAFTGERTLLVVGEESVA